MLPIKPLIGLLGVVSTVLAADSYPNTLYFIRHGEKPADGGTGLSGPGEKRAQCLRNVFGPSSPYNIGYVIAQAYKSDGSRIRPYETVLPVATDLGLKVDVSCDRDDEDCVKDAVAAFVKKSTKNVLLCWEHDELTKIADKIGVKNPPKYPDESFNLIWTIQNKKLLSTTSENCPGLDN